MPDLDFTLPALDTALFKKPMQADLAMRRPSIHAPRFLMLYGSLRERSYSRLLTALGGNVQIFDPGRLAVA